MVGTQEGIVLVRGEFLFPGTEDPVPILGACAGCLERSRIRFQFWKGNDSLLHYTLVDWSSGARRTADLLGNVRGMWGRRRRSGEWIAASFLADFALGGYLEGAGRSMDESGRLDLREVGLRLAYNGRAFLGRETFSLVATCNATGVLIEGRASEQEENLRMIREAVIDTWLATKPLFGWVGIGTRPGVEIPQVGAPLPEPRSGWLVFYPPDMASGAASRSRGSRKGMITRSLDDGSLVVENPRNGPADPVRVEDGA